MKKRFCNPSIILIAIMCLLAGCPVSDTPPFAESSEPAALAVARGRIEVEGGFVRLGVTREGIVAGVNVSEGETVRKGQLLASLDSHAAELAVNAVSAEQRKIEVQAKQLERQLRISEQKASRLVKAAAAGAGDSQSAEEAREKVQRLRDEIENSRADAVLVKQKLSAAKLELAQRSLLSPIDAEVVRRMIQPAEAVSTQSGPAFILLPQADRVVRAELNVSFADLVSPGMKVEITDDNGISPLSLPAYVLRVSPVVGHSAFEEDPLLRSNMRTVECILAFEQPPPSSFRVGQRVLVHFKGGV